MDRLATVLVLALIPTGAAVIALTSASLPSVVATHFGSAGTAGGWMDRDRYVVLMSGLALGVPLVTWAAVAGLPRRWPQLVNLPMRDYWLAPERRAATLAALARFAAGLSLLTAGFLVGLHFTIVAAHATSPPRLAQTPFALLMGAFVVGILILVVALARRFPGTR